MTGQHHVDIGSAPDGPRADRIQALDRRTYGEAAVLDALREGRPLPFAHDPAYVSPQEAHRARARWTG